MLLVLLQLLTCTNFNFYLGASSIFYIDATLIKNVKIRTWLQAQALVLLQNGVSSGKEALEFLHPDHTIE